MVSTVAGLAEGFADGPGIDAKFKCKSGGIAIDSEGSIYVADTWNFRVRKISSDGIVCILFCSSFYNLAQVVCLHLLDPDYKGLKMGLLCLQHLVLYVIFLLTDGKDRFMFPTMDSYGRYIMV